MTHSDEELLRSKNCSFVIYTSNEMCNVMTSPSMIHWARKRKELQILTPSSAIFTSIPVQARLDPGP